MRRFLAVFFFLLFASAASVKAATPISVMSRSSFEASGTNWQPVTTADLLSTTEGSLISSVTFSATTVSNTHKYVTRPYNLARPYSISSVTTNTSDSGTRSMAIVTEITTAEKYVQLVLASSQPRLVGGYYYENNLTTADFSNCDQLKLQNGSADAVIQYMTYSPLRYRTHTGSPSAVGSEVNVTSAQTNVWITFKFDNSAGVTNFTFAIFDWDTRNLIGSSSIMLGGASYPNVQNIRIGNDTHSSSTVQRTNFMDNFVLTTNVAAYPIVPWDTNVFYVNRAIGNDANSGRANTAAAAWSTIAKAAATLTAGQTCYVMDGTYDEAVTFSTDGTVNAPIRLIANSTNVICRNFIVSGDYWMLKGFYFTKVANNTNVTPVVATTTTGLRLLKNYFVATGHGTSGGEGGGIRLGNNANLILRGNNFQYCGTNGVTTSPTHAKDIADANTLWGTNILVEYNRHSHSSEYMNGGGRKQVFRNIAFGPTGTSDWGGTPHIDGLQVNQVISEYHFENNWHADNTTDDAHMFLVQYSLSSFGAVVGNVTLSNGDAQAIWFGEDNGVAPYTTNHYIAHNAVANSRAFQGSPNTDGPIFFRNSSNNWSYNNVFTNVTTSARPYQFWPGPTGFLENYGNDVMFSQGTATAFLTITNPGWENFAIRDLRPSSTSHLRDNGRGLTTTVGSGSSATVVTVAESYWFHDGYGLTRGSAVYVGDDNNLYVTAVNRANSTITVNTAITWSNGEAVGRAYRESGPDIGPYEYGDTILTAATISSTAAPFPVYTVTPNGDTRFVIFYANGVPQDPDYDAPYTYTATGDETVEAEAFALRPQAEMVVTAAMVGEPAEPTSPVTKTRIHRIRLR
jgi:hypothetical protein